MINNTVGNHHPEIADNEPEFHHLESVAQIEYHKVRSNDESPQQQIAQHQEQQFYKHQYDHEYADQALEELNSQSQRNSHLLHQNDDQDDQAHNIINNNKVLCLDQIDDDDDHDDENNQNVVNQEHQQQELEEDDSYDDCNDDAYDQNQKQMMQPHYFGTQQEQHMLVQGHHHNLMQEDAHGNNTDLESITQSKTHLLNLPLASASTQQQQAAHGISLGGTVVPPHHNQSELYKAHMAMQCGNGTQMIVVPATHQSFENGYQTDLTSTSNPPTATNCDNSRIAIDVRTTTEETLATPHEQSSRPPQIPQSQQKPQHVTVIEYTEVFVWGEDKYGQLGIDSQLQTAPQSVLAVGGRTQRPDYIPVPRSCSFNIVIRQVACGQQHSAILTAQGHLYMMGSNKMGQLGVASVCPPQNIQQNLGLTDAQIEQMYTAGSPILVESLKQQKVEHVACGADFTMVICRKPSVPQHDNQMQQIESLTPKSDVYCWGNNASGQLGTSMEGKVSLPVRQEAFDVLDEEIIQISCGAQHSLFLTSEKDIISCGSNQHGQCGFDPLECSQTSTPFKVAAFDSIRIAQVSAGSQHSLFLSEEGHVFASGSNASLQLGIGEAATGLEKTQTPVHVNAGGLDGAKVVQISAGSDSSACVTENGELFLWGRSSVAQGDQSIPQKAQIIQNFVTDVSLGYDLGVAVDNQGLAWSWGQNSHGELGVGDNEPRVHPFPILNLKGKLVTKAHCGHSFVVCLGKNICKEIPQQVDDNQIQQQQQQMQQQQDTFQAQTQNQGHKEHNKKKKNLKKRKNADASRRRSTTRPQTSTGANYSSKAVVNDTSATGVVNQAVLKKQSKMTEQQKNHSFGPMNNLSGNSRASSLDRSTSTGGMLRRHAANARHATTIAQSSTTNKQHRNNSNYSQERTLSNLQSKYGTNTNATLQYSVGNGGHNTTTYSNTQQTVAIGAGSTSSHQAMQITTMASHEKSRMMTTSAQDHHNHTTQNISGARSPISVNASHYQNQQHGRATMHSEYDSLNRQVQSEAPAPDVMKTMKSLKNQIKGFKDENKILKCELGAKATVIDKLEKQLHKLQHDDTHQRQVQELQSEIKRNEMKLRKMKERRNYYRNEKDQQKTKINEMQKDNETLFAQITGMQEQSHAMREENTSLKIKLKKLEKQLEETQEDLQKTKESQQSLKGKNDVVEKQLLSQIRYQETQIQDLSGQLQFESGQKNKMAQEIVHLEKQIQSREDYMVSLENEAIMLRKEIKLAKFNNEKQGYSGFVGNLTQLRSNRGRSTSNNRFVDRSTSAERQQTTIVLSKQNPGATKAMSKTYDKGYDDLPQKDNNQVSSSNFAQEVRKSRGLVDQPPSSNQTSNQQLDARTRLMMSDLSKNPPQKEAPFLGLHALKSQTNVTSPMRKPIQVYQNTQDSRGDRDRSPSMPDLQKCIKSEPEITTAAALPQQLLHQQELVIKSENDNTSQLTYQGVEERGAPDQIGIEIHNQLQHQQLQSDYNPSSNILAVIPLEDAHVYEQSKSEIAHAQAPAEQQPTGQAPLNRQQQQQTHAPLELVPSAAQPVQAEPLGDNSMVLQQQASELPTKQSELKFEPVQSHLGLASCFSDQNKASAPADFLMSQTEPTARKVSTMIPLGAPKGDSDVRDQYKQMLMAKLDMKTIQKRRREKEHSQER